MAAATKSTKTKRAPRRKKPAPLTFEAFALAADQRTRLVDLVAWLRTVGDVAAAHAALRTWASEGKIELRPESGIGLLSDADRALCPVGLRGSILSYARIVAP